MGIWQKLFGSGQKVIVYESRAHEITATKARINRETRLVEAGGGSWLLPDFDPHPLGKERAFLATGPNIVHWPTEEKPAFDVMDDGTKIAITPEHIDQVAEHAHKLGRLAAAGDISLADRLVHLGAGAAIGIAIGFFLLKMLGFSIARGGGATTVTINNASTNATSLATSALFLFGAIRGEWRSNDTSDSLASNYEPARQAE